MRRRRGRKRRRRTRRRSKTALGARVRDPLGACRGERYPPKLAAHEPDGGALACSACRRRSIIALMSVVERWCGVPLGTCVARTVR
eukprot:4070234-Pyramimonas_sp.AAC.1